ncbi:MAG TPA: pyridoxamine 5'-phosphate oxidase family protein [Candidatus Polarisedimenticolia bacterium]|nr:pyridoxamine 5'-phosphate oxidase family protein [Candidatus Polarisedimenticolia bacterium]
MSDEDARAFLKTQKIASAATVDANGWPYVIPLTYIYLGDDLLWLHTGAHQGHFLANLQNNPRVCISVAEIGGMETAGEYLCNGSQLYTSVVVFGEISIIRDDDRVKNWFFDRLREKYVPRDISDQLSPEYPDTGKIIVYRVAIERMTGKRSSGVGH